MIQADMQQAISQAEIDRRLATVFELLFSDIIEDVLLGADARDVALDGAAVLAGESNGNRAVSDASEQ